ncbi:ATP-binding protein [Streptomyces monticola]|uniref:ATP-binding protein n=1 Tax=Streptomyces monticola TaxID=2666263 RepID=A0ABW2JER5_9ACTN
MTGKGRPSAGNLPQETTGLIGRERELDALSALLSGGGQAAAGAVGASGRPGGITTPTGSGTTTLTRGGITTLTRGGITTLTGGGGIGKTRLALRAARDAGRLFPDGVWLAELSPLRSQDPELLALTVSEALRLTDQTVRPMPEVLAEWLADKHLLLVLDTCEHLVQPCARLLRRLTAAAPGVHFLCTSRQPLRVSGERLLAFGPLTVPGPRGDTAAEACEALTLFEQRAAAAALGLAFTAAERTAAAEVCRKLDGIPLAIELAGARLCQMPVAELAARIHERFEILGADGADGVEGAGAAGAADTADPVEGAHPRHRTLRAAIGWSLELCTPEERLLWARLSVFSGGFDEEAAQQVCAGGPLSAARIGPVLAGLVSKSVVVARAGRYQMLDTLREYGAQWLAGLGEDKAVQLRHAEVYLRLARQVDHDWIGPRQREWSARLAVEHANLRAALECHLRYGDAGAAVGMAGALWCFWFCCGFLREGCDFLDRALALAPVPDPAGAASASGHLQAVRDRVKAVWVRGYLANVQGDPDLPERAAAECAALARPGDDSGAALAAAQLTAARLTLYGDQRATVAALAGWPADAPGRHAHPFWVMGRLTLGYALAQEGEFAAVADLMGGLRAECAAQGEVWAASIAEYLCALGKLGSGGHAEAVTSAQLALEGPQALRDTLMSAVILDVLAPATLAVGGTRRAARLQGVAHGLWRHVGGSPHSASPHFRAARQACERGARDILGDTVYDQAFQEGFALAWDEGIAYARGTALPPGHRPSGSSCGK